MWSVHASTTQIEDAFKPQLHIAALAELHSGGCRFQGRETAGLKERRDRKKGGKHRKKENKQNQTNLKKGWEEFVKSEAKTSEICKRKNWRIRDA